MKPERIQLRYTGRQAVKVRLRNRRSVAFEPNQARELSAGDAGDLQREHPQQFKTEPKTAKASTAAETAAKTDGAKTKTGGDS